MKKKLLFITLFVFIFALSVNAQVGNTRPKVAPSPTPTPTPVDNSQVKDMKGSTQIAYTPKDPAAKEVLAAFDKLINGIRNADVEAVTNVYWNSSQLTLFNYNGTVTRTWEQMKKNREATYSETKDVVLDVRDVRVQMTGKDGAVVFCLWKQSSTFRGNPETSTGRMTLVFRRVGKEWKAIHLHTSPDNPDKSRVPASEEQPKNP